LNAVIGRNADFAQYLDRINDKLSPNELPFRQRLLEINKVRILSKHNGVPPNPTELGGYVSIAKDFLEQACLAAFELEFWAVSLLPTARQWGVYCLVA